ncbi:EF-hand domain-containing protein [Roseibaca sp. Y0-43]|uniref:EF-hand domain-containing protein n=1 Tax=Roseibaca sp. Y0-43 TaxID=2816854 RepID=UPI001D0C92E2|nr:EF-hand domain-containing protein [Roseibaca sp. Y0-43]MCC1481001.1 EF-hand domain-containing protein [Roseibaca sp. Y0-43]
MKKTILSALALTIALGAGAAYARGNGDMGPRALPSFEELDRDGNGQVTLEDLQAFAEARRAEMEAKRAERMAERAAQMGERGQRMFDRVDANDDGVVDAEEYAAFTDQMAERMQKRGKGGERGERGWGRH